MLKSKFKKIIRFLLRKTIIVLSLTMILERTIKHNRTFMVQRKQLEF